MVLQSGRFKGCLPRPGPPAHISLINFISNTYASLISRSIVSRLSCFPELRSLLVATIWCDAARLAAMPASRGNNTNPRRATVPY